jgi:hypothetical protein
LARARRRSNGGCWRGYCGGTRYPDGGGLSAAGRAGREKVRLQAAECFAEGLRRQRWRGDCGSHRIRRMCGVGAGARAGRPPWRPGALAGRCARLSGAQLERPGCAGGRPGRLGLGHRPAVDAGPGHRANRPAVPCPLHAARNVIPAAPPRLHTAGPSAPGRRAGRGGHRRVAGRDGRAHPPNQERRARAQRCLRLAAARS